MIMGELLRHSRRWRPGGPPGVYIARTTSPITAPWIASATVRNGYLTVTVTREALETDAQDLAQDPRFFITRHAPSIESPISLHGASEAAVAYAGEDLVRLWLARTPASRRGELDHESLARHVLGNPPYAVLYAHAAAAAVLRWAGSPSGEFRPGRLAEPGELLLLDALSWLPERAATAARRSRVDVFARQLETVAAKTIDVLSTRPFSPGQVPADERLWLAAAAKAGLATGLSLLGVTVPDRL
jgi:arginyl-tRNA synthetase